MSEKRCKELIRLFEERRGAELPPGEKPSDYQLSAIRQMLINEGNMGVNFAKFGPFGLRAAMFVSRLEDVVINGIVVKRKVNGPPHWWNGCRAGRS